MISVIIQAGGGSRRMGEDKGLSLFRGEYLIQAVISRVTTIGDELLVTSNTPEHYSFLGFPVFADILPGEGALAGLLTALTCAKGDLAVVVGCDMPFVNPFLLDYEIKRMTDDFDAVVPASPEGFEPFHAVYRREPCRKAVKAALEEEKKQVTAWFRMIRLYQVSSDEILRFDPLGVAFFNINNRADLKEAERIALSLNGDAG